MSLDLAMSEGMVGPLAAAYGAGVLTSLTPCVYPLIPITLALFGAQGKDTSKLKGFCLSLCYVLGIAVTYTTLGMLSAKTGMMFGSMMGNPYVILPIVGLFVILALYTLDIINFKFIGSMQTKANSVGGTGFVGAFLMGTVSGFVAAPCVGPALVAILAVAAKSQNPIWGGALLFTYAMGLGLLFILLGTFSGLKNSMPKSGNWLSGVKIILTVAIFGLILFLLQPFAKLPLNPNDHAVVLAALMVMGLGLAYVGTKKAVKPASLAATIMIAISVFQVAFPGGQHFESKITWMKNKDQALLVAGEKQKIVMVDFFADWCAACKEYEHTFASSDVASAVKDIIATRVDLSVDSDENDAIQDKYEVPGLPCILFLDSAGKEIPGTRLTGYKNSKDFVEHVKKVKQQAGIA